MTNPDATQGSLRKKYCASRQPTPRVFGPNVGGERARLILLHGNKWANGTTLNFAFFDSQGPDPSWAGAGALKDQVRGAFKRWTDVGIGISFREVTDRASAQVRVAFQPGDGHWSYIGRDILKQGVDDRTLNLDPLDGIADGEYGIDVACHEIGHTLGFPHEHQNPNAGIVWNEEAVYRALAAPPNRWDRQTTYANIIEKIAPDRVRGSSWDPDSIMHYPFEPGLIEEPAKYRDGLQPRGGISETDKQWVKAFYPVERPADFPSLALFESRRLQLQAGAQVSLVLKPTVTRFYEMRTFGASDTVMVLNQRRADGTEHYVTADDDSGEERNAYIRRRLQTGETYLLKLRLYYAAHAGETAVMWW
ncbi:MAG: hypothetical protein IT379_14855 [Deltaproteobacteria bacterium]|nr:hypothetical protein [Deltaproteobacteria bacterium]